MCTDLDNREERSAQEQSLAFPGIIPPVPLGEAARLADLHASGLLETGNDDAFDAIVRVAALVTQSPVALITLIDEHRQTFKARIGIDGEAEDRRDAFCAYAILEPARVLHVPNTTLDARFRDNRSVTGAPHFRFYCGVPIVSAAGRALGTLCVLDYEPRELETAQLDALEDLSSQVSALIQARTRMRELEEQIEADDRAHVVVLRTVGEAVESAPDLDTLLEIALAAIIDALDLSAGGLWWHDGENLAVDPLWIDPSGELKGVQRAREGLAYPPTVMVHTLETATRHGTDVLPTVVTAALQDAGITGSHAIPIAVHGTVVGAFELIPSPAGEPSPRCLLAATQAAAEVGRWIERDRSPQWLAQTTSPDTAPYEHARIDATQIRRRAAIQARLARAVVRGELAVAYEPIVRLSDGTTTAVEALARWYDDELGHVGPAEFIPIAEESDTIRLLGTHVRRRALHDLPGLRQDTDGGNEVAVWANVAANELIEGFANAVLADLRAAGIAPQRLTVEVTERLALGPHNVAAAQLAELRAVGVGIALDDFGTGFTSLTQLRTLPLSHVKVDRSFTAGLAGAESARVQPIVRGIIQLAHSLGLQVVTEGIETQEQLDIVRELGADLAQGHYLR